MFSVKDIREGLKQEVDFDWTSLTPDHVIDLDGIGHNTDSTHLYLFYVDGFTYVVKFGGYMGVDPWRFAGAVSPLWVLAEFACSVLEVI